MANPLTIAKAQRVLGRTNINNWKDRLICRRNGKRRMGKIRAKRKGGNEKWKELIGVMVHGTIWWWGDVGDKRKKMGSKCEGINYITTKRGPPSHASPPLHGSGPALLVIHRHPTLPLQLLMHLRLFHFIKF